MKALKSALTNPFVVMWLVVSMYLVKAICKIGLGSQINSPMIAGDGFHNLADILEALAVIAVIWVAKRPVTNDYPFGRKNIEFFTSLAIGGSLLILAVQFAVKSMVGLLAIWPNVDHGVRAILPLPEHVPLVMNATTLPWVLAITIGSVMASFLVSRYQITIGRKCGHASMIADGEETASDGRIELITLAGVVGEYVFSAPWLEYPLGLLIAIAIARTGWELFRGGARVLLQHSIGAEHEEEIRKRCMRMAGVLALDSLKTFQIGSTAVCIMTITTEHRTGTLAQLKYGVEHHVRKYLLEAGFKDCEINLRFEKPEPARHRIAYAAVAQGDQLCIAPDVESATHVIVCDLENGMVVRTKEEAKPQNLVEYLKRKRVVRLYLFHADPPALPGVEVASSTSYQPKLLGLV